MASQGFPPAYYRHKIAPPINATIGHDLRHKR